MKPVNKLQLYSRSTRYALYFLYFAIAGLIIVFIISYFVRGGDSTIADDPNGGTPGSTSIPVQSGGPIAAVAPQVNSYSLSNNSVGVVVNSEYEPDTDTPRDQDAAFFVKKATNQRMVIRVFQTNPTVSVETYARESSNLYGEEVQDARAFKKSIFNGFRYVVLSKSRTTLFSVAYIKTLDRVHVLQVNAPVDDGTMDSVRTQNEGDLDQLLSSYNLSFYEEKENETLSETGYPAQ